MVNEARVKNGRKMKIATLTKMQSLLRNVERLKCRRVSMTDYKRLFSVMLKLSRIRLQTNFRNENHYGFNVSTGLSIYFYRIDNEAGYIWFGRSSETETIRTLKGLRQQNSSKARKRTDQPTGLQNLLCHGHAEIEAIMV